MPFDPTQPYEVLPDAPNPPKFDPSQPYEVVKDSTEPPNFDPSLPYEIVKSPNLIDRIKAWVAPGLEAMGRAIEQDPAVQDAAGDAIRTAAGAAGAFAQKAFRDSNGFKVLPGPLPGAHVADLSTVLRPMTPTVTLPRVPQQTNGSVAAQVGAGAANVGIGVAESLTTPLSMATLGAMGVMSRGAQRLLSAAFGIDMGRHVPEAAAQAGQALEEGTLQEKVEAVGGLATSAGMAGIAAKHALTPTRIAAARGVARELDRAKLADDAPTAAALDPVPRRGDIEPGFTAAEALEASDVIFQVSAKAPTVPKGSASESPVLDTVDPVRVEEIRRAAKESGADGALRELADPTPAEQSAAAIALAASDDLAQALARGRVTQEAAEAIARAAPGDAAAQAVGMAALLDVGTPEAAALAVRRYRERYRGVDPADILADPATMVELVAPEAPTPGAPPAGGGAFGLPSGTTPVSGARMPVAVNRVVPGSQDIPGIFQQLERVMRAAGTRTPIRVGRMGQMKRWASGFFRPREEVIRLNSASNIPTATHEVAHALAREFWSRQAGAPNASNLLRKTVPKAATAELRALGVSLYGKRRPAAGYVEEGWAEFVRHYLTTDDVAKVAPNALRWFEQTVLPKHPEVARELKTARDMIDVWRGQGDVGRANAMMQPHPAKLANALRKVGQVLSSKAQVEQLGPLEQASRFWQERTGKALRPSRDPYLVATRFRGIAPTVLTRFVESQPIDLWGNKVAARPLADVLAPLVKDLPWRDRMLHAVSPRIGKVVTERMRNFSFYLWARRTMERAGKEMETGLSLDDARTIFQRFDSPEFRLAAGGYYKWWDAVLDYYGQAGPANAELVRAIKAGSSDYVPLPRVFESVAGGAQSGSGGGLYRMHGSGRPIYDVMESTLRVAGSIIEKAHRDVVANTVIDLAQQPGMGWLVEKVPIDKVRQRVSMAKVRDQLEAMGVDTTGVPDAAMVEYYAEAKNPGGVDAVYARKGPGGKTEWYAIEPRTYEILAGVDNPQVAAGITAGLFASTTRLFKLGTVGLRPAFQMVTNPLRDAQNFMIQGSANPRRSFTAYFGGLADMLRVAIEPVSGNKVKASEYWELLNDLGVPMANSLAHDIAQTRSAIRGAVHGRGMRVIAEPINSFREAISAFESVPREAELIARAAEVGWAPGMKLTPDQAVALTVAAKRVTTDFTAGGSASRKANLYIPFYNVAIQGMRTAGRVMRSAVDKQYAERNLVDQRTALGRVAVGGTFLAALTLSNWLRNKDQEWYRALPWRERFLYTHVLGPDGIVVRVPRPIEWGNVFMVLPEALADSWYLHDPETATAAIEHVVKSMNPVGLPVPISAALEQASNRDFFWDRPIVPRAQVDLPPGDQRTEYTSWLARALGDAVPDVISPRRVDAAIRQFGGGAASDLVEAIGLQGELHDRGWEPSDVPIVGTLFRRGGAFTAANRHIQSFYDTYAEYAARSKSKVRPLAPQEAALWRVLKSEKEDIELVRQIAFRTKDFQSRQRLWRNASERARHVNDAAKRVKATATR